MEGFLKNSFKFFLILFVITFLGILSHKFADQVNAGACCQPGISQCGTGATCSASGAWAANCDKMTNGEYPGYCYADLYTSDCPPECRKGTSCGSGFIGASGCSGSGPNFGCSSIQACCKAKTCDNGPPAATACGNGQSLYSYNPPDYYCANHCDPIFPNVCHGIDTFWNCNPDTKPYLLEHKYCGPCNTGAPTGLTVTSTSLQSATANWVRGANGNKQAIYIGSDKSKVSSLCPLGAGPGTGCLVKNENLPSATQSYATGNILAAGTVYYYRVLNIQDDACGASSTVVSKVTSCMLSPTSLTINVGQISSLTTVVNASADITQVTYSASPTGIATVTSPDTTYPYSTTVTGVAGGTTTITNTVYVAGVPACSATSSVSVNNPDPWWQVKDSDVSTNSSLSSDIPGTNYFNLPGTGTFPGVTAYGTTTNLTLANIAAAPSNWLVQTTSSNPKVYDYQFFANQIPADTSIYTLPSNNLDQAAILANNTPSYGYYWYKFNGVGNGLDLNISSAITLGTRRVILLVDSADLNINSTVNLTDGQGSLLVIVGKGSDGTEGDIFVNPSVGNTAYDMEGLYLADSNFLTGSSALSLKVRGSIVAYDGISLQRNLGAAGNNNPSELFEYAPDQILLFPSKLGTRKINWKEVAP